ncbi:alcohol dehydrogenase NADP [Nesidiocoris tenuis]|uniref:Alcohol dehydrogenase NADP n=1 Tax=Nesidiocoris tenuis TaxID=355587 RepID=A0ABN7AQB9_9HEMI|nr:alcohol dehydrogenase NADP [Nesidiocoris tenuis]
MALAADSVLTAANMKMPVIGLGTWQGGEELEKVLDTALEAGYRHIDTAYVYQNEQHIGVVIKKWLDSGKLKREDLFIVTKLCPTHLRPDDIEKSINESLKKLQLSHVDLFLIHNPVGLQFSDNLFPIGPNGELLLDMSTDLVACWKAMENLVDAGLTKSIGLSNFNIGQIQRILDSCRIKPANLQVELYVYMQQPELVQFCKANGITICAYGPIGSPSLKKFTESNNLPTENLNILSPMTDPIVTDLAKKYGKAPAQILLRFLLQLGVAVIPKSSNPERLRSNIDIFDFNLTEEDFAKLKSLDRGEKGRQFGNSGIFAPMMPHPEYPFPK